MTLNEGDMLFTGTPDGVSQVKVGDHLQATLSQDGKKLIGLDFKVENRF